MDVSGEIVILGLGELREGGCFFKMAGLAVWKF